MRKKFFMGLLKDGFGSPMAKKKVAVDDDGYFQMVKNVNEEPQLGAIGILRMRISEKKLSDAEKMIVSCKE